MAVHIMSKQHLHGMLQHADTFDKQLLSPGCMHCSSLLGLIAALSEPAPHLVPCAPCPQGAPWVCDPLHLHEGEAEDHHDPADLTWALGTHLQNTRQQQQT